MTENPKKMENDKTSKLLEQLLSELYKQQSTQYAEGGESYVKAGDGQYLGKITDNPYDQKSILNQYGPYGSVYSTTSIFNEYSNYASPYGSYSLNNPYCSNPPQLFINGKFKGNISINQYVQNRIPTEAFLYSLRNHFNKLLKGEIYDSEIDVRCKRGESFIIAKNDVFLGRLNSNKFDQESIFNRFSPYGNKFSQTSIFNRFSPYGNQFSQLSPYNRFSQTPPKIYLRGKFYGYLTVNPHLKNGVDPDKILDWAEQNVPRQIV